MNISLKLPEPDENTYLPFAAIRSFRGLFAGASGRRLDEREREMIYLSFFKRIPQHEIGRQYGRSRIIKRATISEKSTVAPAEMEGMA